MTQYNLVESHRRFGKVTLSIFTNTVDTSYDFETGECSEAELHRNFCESIGKTRRGGGVQ